MNNFPCYNNMLTDIEYEEWLPIVGYEEKYLVSNMGRVKGVKRIVKHGRGGNKTIAEKIMKQYVDFKGYCQLQLSQNGQRKTWLVHQLVAIAFLPNLEHKRDVHHKFSIKLDNRLTQLEWLTPQEHAIYNFPIQGRGETHSCYGKLGVLNKKSKPVLQYDLNGILIKRWDGCRDAGRKSGVNYRSIAQCCNTKTKTAGGYIWKFEKVA